MQRIAWPTVAVLALAVGLLVAIWRFLPAHPEALVVGGALASIVVAQMRKLLGAPK